MKIYTRKGDAGTTSLIGGTRVQKHHLRIQAYGTIDELNSYLGLLTTLPEAEAVQPLLRIVQDRLFTLGSLLAADPEGMKMELPNLFPEDVEVLEHSIDALQEPLPELRNFILAGGCAANAHAHVARTICRRAERAMVELAEFETVDALHITYVNRLSDWLFVVARHCTSVAGAEEIAWRPRH
jgi:cob(I)alamin adenosyltransferase